MAKSYKDSTILEIHTKLTEILSIDIKKDLVKADILGEYKFVDREFELGVFFDLLKALKDVEFGYLPYNILQELVRKLVTVWGIMSTIKNFSLEEGNTKRRKETVLAEFDEVDAAVTPFIANIIQLEKTLKPIPQAEVENVFEKTLTREMKLLEEKGIAFDKEFNIALDKIKEAIQLTNEKSQEFGIAKYSLIFNEESERHKAASRWWLTAVIALLALIIGCAIALLFWVEMPTEPTEVIQFSVTKVIVLTTLFFGLSLCMRNFKAQKHNQVVNRHRHNALTTFEAFSKAATDPQTKNAVLLEATHSIFANQNSGYTSNESTDSDFPNKIIEIVKTPKAG